VTATLNRYFISKTTLWQNEMAVLAQHRIKVRYTGGPADQNVLPAYDGVTSIDGITRSIQIILHAYMTGEVVSRATALRGASLIIKPAKPGSFVFELIALIEAYPATSTIAASIAAPMFYDFLKTALRRATGDVDAEPETPSLRRLYERRDPPPLKRVRPADLDEPAETLEGSLQDGHRPIGGASSVGKISISTPRTKLITLDAETKDWVNKSDAATKLEVLTGNVTRYNSLSRNGRAFVDQLGKVAPFRPDPDFPEAELGLITWSLHGTNIGMPNKLELRARRISSANGRIKRLILADCRRAPTS
jgi:hypothetical protein